MKADYEGTLRRLSQTGYRHIETGRHFGDSVESLRRLLEGLWLQVIAGGSTMGSLQKDAGKAVENALGLHARYLVCYWPWLTGAQSLTRSEVLHATENCNAVGKRCRAVGLRFAAHDHNRDFKDLDGQAVFDLLLEQTQPDLVAIKLDVCGADPTARLRRDPGRIELRHAKDTDSAPKQGMVAVSDGVRDFGEMLYEAARAGTHHILVEHDRPRRRAGVRDRRLPAPQSDRTLPKVICARSSETARGTPRMHVLQSEALLLDPLVRKVLPQWTHAEDGCTEGHAARAPGATRFEAFEDAGVTDGLHSAQRLETRDVTRAILWALQGAKDRPDLRFLLLCDFHGLALPEPEPPFSYVKYSPKMWTYNSLGLQQSQNRVEAGYYTARFLQGAGITGQLSPWSRRSARQRRTSVARLCLWTSSSL